MDKLGDVTASPSLVPLSTKEELLSWAEKMKPHLPYSTSIHNNLTLHGGGYVSHGRFYVLQGKPSTHAVVYWGTFQSPMQHLALFCTEEEVDHLIKALSTADFVNWDRGLFIHHVPHYLKSVLQKLAEEKGTKINTKSYVNTYTYKPHLDTQPKRIGPGFRVCLLSKAGVHKMFENDKYGRLDQLEVTTHMAQHVPFVGVYLDKGVTHDTIVNPNSLPIAGDEELPVAWVGTDILGVVGMLTTDEGYRRRGFGSLILTVAARRQASLLKIIPHAFIETTNTAASAMLEGLPAWKLTHNLFWLTTPM